MSVAACSEHLTRHKTKVELFYEQLRGLSYELSLDAGYLSFFLWCPSNLSIDRWFSNRYVTRTELCSMRVWQMWFSSNKTTRTHQTVFTKSQNVHLLLLKKIDLTRSLRLPVSRQIWSELRLLRAVYWIIFAYLCCTSERNHFWRWKVNFSSVKFQPQLLATQVCRSIWQSSLSSV